ncbi:XkdX family protein [Bacillus sp. IT-13CA1]|uniref:XkdX family protein n=1 Tax=Bacillus sp. IT-13CA1 TaxID=3035929 RepID=UPI0039E0DE21
MNFWVLALYYNWATTDMVKQALYYKDCTPEDFKDGVDKMLVSPEEYKEIFNEEYPPEAVI